MPSTLKAGLWDVLRFFYFFEVTAKNSYQAYTKEFEEVSASIWFNFLREPLDTRPADPEATLSYLRNLFFRWEFHSAYDFLEFMASKNPADPNNSRKDYESYTNKVFVRERAALRFSDGILIQITDQDQLEEVTNAASNNASSAVAEHIRSAARLYSDPVSPDYRNSIKESISAVEAAVSYATGRKSSGITKPLKYVAERYEMHQSLRDGFEKIYGWTSDASGIRHRLMDKSTVNQDDARFMLISCSAFANYLISLKVRHGQV